MTDVSIRELRIYTGDVIDRVVRGERITVVRAGKATAELRPVRPGPMSVEALLSRWRRLPAVDPVALRADIDEVLES